MATSYSLFRYTPNNDSAAPSTEGMLIPAPSTAGVHALWDGNGAFPGPFTNPTVPSKLSVTFTASWDGGDVTVTGTDVYGAAQSEVFADAAGTTVQGTKVFATVTAATKETPAGVAGNGASIGIGLNTEYSKPWAANNRDWGLTVSTSGTLTGTWTLWATDKKHPSLTDDTDWVDMSAHADFVETNPAGATTKWRVNSVLIKATWLRLKYVTTSGTGNLLADVTAETAL